MSKGRGPFASRYQPTHLFQCPHCELGFNFKKLFETHLLHFHRDQTNFKCMDCSESGHNWDAMQLAQHIQRDHVNNSDVPCNFCGEIFPRVYELKGHVWTMHSKQCPACYQTMADRIEVHLGAHTCIQPDINSYELPSATCSKCRLFFPDKTKLAKHIEVCRPFLCHLCERSQSTQEGMISHYVAKHGNKGGGKSNCAQCTDLGDNEEELAKHLELAHNPNTEVVCDICGRTLKNKDSLKSHMRKFHNKPFNCVVCGMGFSREKALRKHEIDHTGINPEKCHICGKTFSEKSKLSKHVNVTHNEARNYACRICDKRFKQKSPRDRHERTIHAEESQYYCTEGGCDKVYRREDTLLVHMNEVHGKDVVKNCVECGITFPTAQYYRTHRVKHHPQEINTSNITRERPVVEVIEERPNVLPLVQNAEIVGFPIAQQAWELAGSIPHLPY